MASIFISHSHKDFALVSKVAKPLRARGHFVRITSDEEGRYTPDADWLGYLEDNINTFDLRVFFITSNFMRSMMCGGELFWAKASGHFTNDIVAFSGEKPSEYVGARNLFELGGMSWPSRLVKLIEERLSQDPGLQAVVAPFPGFEPFGEQYAGQFFGREIKVRQIASTLRLRAAGEEDRLPIKLLIGASGVGKTSLLRAGLFPALKTEISAQVAEGQNRGPAKSSTVLSLAASFDLSLSPKEAIHSLINTLLAGRAQRCPSDLDEAADLVIAAYPPQKGQSAYGLMFLDGFERVLDDDTALNPLLRIMSSSARINLVTTLRSDVYPSLLEAKQFRRLITPYIIHPVHPEHLPEIIRKPLTRYGWTIDDEVVEKLVEGFEDAPESLPLLNYILRELWDASENDHKCAADRRISLNFFNSFCGDANVPVEALFSRVLARSGIDDIVDSHPEAFEALALQLAVYDPAARVLRPSTAHPGNQEQSDLARKIGGKRFLSIDGGETSERPLRVRIVHDLVLRLWPLLSETLTRLQPDLELLALVQEGIRRNGSDWFERLSAEPEKWAQWQLLIKRHAANLPEDVHQAYLRYLQSRETEQVRVNTINEAVHRARTATAHREIEVAEAFLKNSDPVGALVRSAVAIQIAAGTENDDVILATAKRALYNCRELSIFSAEMLKSTGTARTAAAAPISPETLRVVRDGKVIDVTKGLAPDVWSQYRVARSQKDVLQTLSDGGWIGVMTGAPAPRVANSGKGSKPAKEVTLSLFGPDMDRSVRFHVGTGSVSAAQLLLQTNCLLLAFVFEPETGPKKLRVARLRLDWLNRRFQENDHHARLLPADELALEFSGNPALCLSGAGPRLLIFDEVEQSSEGALRPHKTPRARLLNLYVQDNGGVTIANVVQCPELEKGLMHNGMAHRVSEAKFSPGSEVVVTIGADRRLSAHTIKGDDALTSVQLADRSIDAGIGYDRAHLGMVTVYLFRRDGSILFTGGWDGDIKAWDISTGAMLERFNGHKRRIAGLSLTQDGSILESVSDDGTVRTWDVKALLPARGKFAVSDRVRFCEESPKTQRLWILDSSGSLHTESQHANQLPTLVYQFPRSSTLCRPVMLTSGILMVPDGPVLRLFNTARMGDPPTELDPGLPAAARMEAMSAFGLSRLAIGYSIADGRSYRNHVAVFDMSAGKLIATSPPLPTATRTLGFISQDEIVIGLDSHNFIFFWVVSEDRYIERKISGSPRARVLCMAVARSTGRLFLGGAFGSDLRIQVWNLNERRALNFTHWLSGHVEHVSDLSLSADEQTLASASRDCTVRFWDTQSLVQIGQINNFNDWVETVAFSAKGEWIVTGEADTRLVRRWGAQPLNFHQSGPEGPGPLTLRVIDLALRLRPELADSLLAKREQSSADFEIDLDHQQQESESAESD